MLVLQEKIIDGVETSIDQVFEIFVDNVDEVIISNLKNNISNVEKLVDEFQLDYDKYSINGVSYLYATFSSMDGIAQYHQTSCSHYEWQIPKVYDPVDHLTIRFS